jgi:hypothetical protein
VAVVAVLMEVVVLMAVVVQMGTAPGRVPPVPERWGHSGSPGPFRQR